MTCNYARVRCAILYALMWPPVAAILIKSNFLIMNYDPNDSRPMAIQIIRSAVLEATQRRAKAGRLGEVPEKRPQLFTIHSGEKWLELEHDKPSPKKLFGNFWHQNELCILFADTNMGKSILAVQLGNSISKQDPIGEFALQTEPCNVLYVDFELSAKQFQLRYTMDGPCFSDTFYRAEFNPQVEVPPDYKDYDEYLNYALEHAIEQTKASVLIIDNITCLRNNTDRASEALPLMQHLKALKRQFNLSILVLAHTPKRNPASPLSRNDLQGSKMLINFADSAFAIGESQKMAGYRYLKQIKQRSSAEVYGADNVCLCRIERQGGFLGYVFTGNDS
ncbi:MAG: hypothetical protein EOP54_28535, partial [Sphingobacteriales bacterium]